MERYRFYIHIDEAENRVLTAGLPFATFIDGLPEKPQNMLLLSNDFADAKYDLRLRMDYADADNIERLYADKVADYGDFHWVDYQSDACKEKLEGQELAGLLFAAKAHRLLGSPLFPSLRNDYLYFSHDDRYYSQIFMRNVQHIRHVLKYKLETSFKGRKHAIAPLPDSLLDTLCKASNDAIVFDFEMAQTEKRCTRVRYYVAGSDDRPWFLDTRMEVLQKAENGRGGWLVYDARRMLWSHQEVPQETDAATRGGA